MAIKPIIYKLRIALSDLERNYYDSLSLTVALHPSETIERMMARVIAYCINAQEGLAFTKGLSAVDEPDIWVRTLEGETALWVDVGEPSSERIKKATRLANRVKVYCFNTKSEPWWNDLAAKITRLDASVYRINLEQLGQLTRWLERTMDLSVTITGESAYVTCGNGEVDIGWKTLKD